MRDASAIAGALVLIAAASALAACREEKQLGYLTDPVPTSLNCDRILVPVRPAEPGAQYHIDVRQEGKERVCYVS